MLGVGANFRNRAVVDRARGPREIGKDVLIVRPTAIRNHRLDQSDFPALKLVASAPHRHFTRAPAQPQPKVAGRDGARLPASGNGFVQLW